MYKFDNLIYVLHKGFIRTWFIVALLVGSVVGTMQAQAQPYVYVGNQNSWNVTVIDVSTDTVVATIEGVFRPHGVAIMPDGTRAYVTNYGYGKTVSVIDTEINDVVDTVNGVGNDPGGIAITPDGTRAYVANRVSNNVSVIDIQTNSVIATVATARYPVSVAITPDGSYAYVANQTGLRVTMINTETNLVEDTIIDNKRHVGIAITPDGSRAYVVNDLESSFSVIDTVTNAVIGTFPTGGSHPYWVAISPDGSRAYVPNVSSHDVSVIDTATNNVVAIVPVGTSPFKVAVTPDGTKAYVGNLGSDNVSVIDTASNTVIATIVAGDAPLGIAITPDVSPNIEVDPSEYDFGDVEIGYSSMMYLNISNSGGGELTIEDVHMKNQIPGDPFTLLLPLSLPVILSSNSSLDVEVMYNSTLIFAQQSNELVIESDDEDEGVIEVAFRGRGVLVEEPSQAVSGLLTFIDDAIGNEMISGEGPGKSADNRVNALKNMLESAGDLIDEGLMQDTCEQLNSIYKKVDGMPKPPDFISGEAVPGVAAGVLEIMSDLSCP